MNDDRTDNSDLVEAFWSDALDDAQRIRLNALSAGEQRDVAKELRLATAIGALLDESSPQETADLVLAVIASSTASRRIRTYEAIERRLPQPGRPRRWAMAGAIASLAAAAAVILWLVRPADQRDLPEIADVQGNALIESSRGYTHAAVGQRLQPDDVIATNETAVALRYADGTSISVSGNTRLAVAGDGTAKAVRLENGSIEAEVAPQPTGHPMLLSTPKASAVVVGTHFRLAALRDYARLDVTRGIVRMTDSSQKSVDVEAGQYAVTSDDLELAVHQLTAGAADAAEVDEAIAQSIRHGMVGHWTFDDVPADLARDSSGNHNDGMVSGAPALAARIIDGQRMPNGCLSFDGIDDGVSVAGSSSLDRLETFTVTAWINNRQPNGNRDTADHFNIVSKGWYGNSAGSWNLLWSSKDIGARPVVSFAVRRNGESGYNWVGFQFTEKHVWAHVAAIFDGTTLTIYQDGLRKDGERLEGPGSAFTDQLDLVIGGQPPKNFAHPWNGLLDDVRIYDRALSVAEIKALCAAR